MKFGVWHPFGDASNAAPDLPGLLQARAEVPMPYPRGKSAMVLYAGCRADESLRRYVRADGAEPLRRAGSHGAHWVRFGETASPERELERLTRQFSERFGALPVANAESPPPSGARTSNG